MAGIRVDEALKDHMVAESKEGESLNGYLRRVTGFQKKENL